MKIIMNIINGLFILSRPKQLIKNLLVLIPVVFAGNLLNWPKIESALIAFVAFCLASSAVYSINDLIDQEKDRAHPIKKSRPIASGVVSPHVAIIFFIILAVLSILISFYVSLGLCVVISLYILLVTSYSIWLKHKTLIDIISIALGFVLRILAGIIVIGAVFSPWIIGFTFFFAFFLASSKRESEHKLHSSQGLTAKRKVFAHYTEPYLQMLTNSAATASFVVYFIYAALDISHSLFIISVLPVLYGIYRFLWIIRSKEIVSDDPIDLFFKDNLLMLNVLLYAIIVVAILYVN